jgi:hypothetical protein
MSEIKFRDADDDLFAVSVHGSLMAITTDYGYDGVEVEFKSPEDAKRVADLIVELLNPSGSLIPVTKTETEDDEIDDEHTQEEDARIADAWVKRDYLNSEEL